MSFDKAEQAQRAQAFEQAQLAQGAVKPILPLPPLTGARDMKGTKIQLGDTVARPVSDNVVHIRLCKVTGIEARKVYLDGSRLPIKHPERLLVIKA